MVFPPVSVPLSGERFHVTYHITAPDEDAARERAQAIALEQTVELSGGLVPPGDMQQVIGQLERMRSVEGGQYEIVVSYPVEASGFELLQLLNVIYGNISMLTGIRVIEFDLPPVLLDAFPGPRFGRAGVRTLLNAPERPLLGTAIKPMGYPPDKLADYAYQFALGGLDVIKDDHGLANQSFAPFRKRVEQCAAAVRRANEESGGRTLYVPNITGPSETLVERALFAKEVGAGGVEVITGAQGFDALRLLAADERLHLPIFSHPGLLGTYTVDPQQGFTLGALYGQVMRLAGADVTIYTNFGGRFPTTREDCRHLVHLIDRPMGHVKPILPMPGGGMTMETVPELLDFYGRDIILLISGGLFSPGPDLVENARRFRAVVEQAAASI